MKLKTWLVTVLAALTAAGTAWAEPMTMRIVWELNGPPSQLIDIVREGRKLQAQINPDVGHEMWAPVAHGSNTGTLSLTVYYKSAEHFAQAEARERDSEVWRDFINRFPADQFPTRFTSLNSVLVSPGGVTASGGEVLAIFGFDLKGPSSELAQWIQRGADIQKRINPGASISLSMPAAAGNLVNTAAVLTRYESMEAWAEGRSILQTNEEWAAYIAEFPGETYPVRYTGMSRAIDIN